MLELKKAITPEELCQDKVPPQLKFFLTYCRGLKFDEEPNYKMLHNNLSSLLKDLNIDENAQFDWVIHKQRLIDQRIAAEEAEKRAKEMSNSRV